jgi:glycosyltransferase involved in cell wall biosynthesis
LKNKIKIVFIIVSLKTGGAQSMLLRLLNEIDKNRFNVTVISLTDGGDLGQSVIDLEIPLITANIKKNIFNIFALIKLCKIIQKIAPDVVHTWMYHSDLIGGLLAKILHVPRIVWGVRSADFISVDTPLSTKLVVKLCAKLSRSIPNVIIYNSQKGLTYHENLGYTKNKSHVIYNGVDIDRFKPQDINYIKLRRMLSIAENKKIIGIVARYDYLKNHKGFVKMAKFINDCDDSCDFLMIGENIKDNKKLLSLIEQNNLLKNFHLLDSISNIEDIISGLNAVVITSLSEAFPNVMIEAMACGIPCFSTDVGDVEQLTYDREWLVSVEDMEKLANVCVQYLDLDAIVQKNIKENMIKYARKNYSSKIIVERYEAIYVNNN